jgi:hypothetical protein
VSDRRVGWIHCLLLGVRHWIAMQIQSTYAHAHDRIQFTAFAFAFAFDGSNEELIKLLDWVPSCSQSEIRIGSCGK